MRKDGPLQEKSFAFALHITLFCKKLMYEKKEYVLSKQLLRSGTSIGANIEEAQDAESKKDFISKLSISLKESKESRYWLRLIGAADFVTKSDVEDLIGDVNEIISILTVSIKTAKHNLSLIK